MKEQTVDRRQLAKGLAVAGLGVAVGVTARAQERRDAGPRFKLKYAPHFGMFSAHAGEDHVAQLEFMRDEGFVAIEDNGMPGRETEAQERIAKGMERLGMEMGVFVAHGEFREVTFASDKTDARERIEADLRAAVELAKRVHAKWCTVVPGAFDPGLEWDYQTANVIENLKRASEICEPSGLVMVLEPLNPWTNHPGLFLTKVPQAYLICRAVGSSSCKILDDLYHQQITEGNLIPNLERAWAEIAYIQVGDNPGRKEPTTGEINYRNLFKYIYEKGFDGIVGMEHGNARPGKEGERAVLDAYAWCDDFS
ncbi:MAG: TIM barrel protein [Acidobacteriota bacterium]|nr:TIM barrel protein [Acidobacteriota bacterium]